jgi:hypothetical protein
MFVNWHDGVAGGERYKDLLREAERDRLVREKLAGRGGNAGFYCRALIWLGSRLVAWGWRLQERYGAGTAAPALRERPLAACTNCGRGSDRVQAAQI